MTPPESCSIRKSPLLWIEKTFKLTPQPLKKGVSPDEPVIFYRPSHFEPFAKGKHLTWQQWLFFRAVEWGIAGKAPRKISVASGHGTGKSSELALFVLWFLFCHKDAQLSATAPTAQQMFDILWKEVSLWHQRMPAWMKDIFEVQGAYVRVKEREKTWFARAATARKENPEALAGVHGENVALVGDEASGIHEAIFETSQGALTSKNIFFILISNPTRLSGFFFNTHHKLKHSWQTLQFDSEESPIVDPSFVQGIIDTYGKDSSAYLIRVKGRFPTLCSS